MLPGECVNDTVETCFDCRADMEIKVLSSAAGYYLGFMCPNCGPYSRESGYFADAFSAKAALATGSYGR
jgi:hypothetical protein